MIVVVICKTCGIEVKKKSSDIKRRGDNHYCSRVCFYTAGEDRRRGGYKKCQRCKKVFYVSKCNLEITKFCSRKCGYQRPKPTKKCATCGKLLSRIQERVNCTYCSRGCTVYGRPKTGIYKKCPVCNDEFYVTKSRIKEARFCSNRCTNEWQSRNKVAIICKICKREFKVSPCWTVIRNPTYCSIGCRDKDPDYRIKILKMVAAQQTGNPNKFEKLGYSILDDLGVDYIPQHLIGNKFCVDAFIPSVNTVLQFDGDYWHGNLEKFPTPDKRQARRIKLDISQDAYMAKCGYTVVRIWQSELNKDNKVIRDRLGKIFVASLSPQLSQLDLFGEG